MALGGKEKIEIVATARDQASPTLRTLSRNVQALGNKGRGPLGGLLSGLGGISPLALGAAAGIGALSAMFVDGVAGAIAQEASLKRLDTILRANVTSYDGNVDKVNELIERSMALGFEDDDLRDSFDKLIVSSGNVEQALKDQRLAMDIARGRNIDLAAATDIVVKANMGNVGALRRMGIQLEKGATKTEILMELQKRYGGQAEAFADTTEGKMRAARIQIDELAETFGEILVPAIGDAAAAMTAFMTNFSVPKQAVEDKKEAFLAALPSEDDVRARLQALQDLEHGYLYGDILDPKTTLYTLDIGGVKTELNRQISDLQTYLNTLVDPRDESDLGLALAEQITNSAAQGLTQGAPRIAQAWMTPEVEANIERALRDQAANAATAAADAGVLVGEAFSDNLAKTIKDSKGDAEKAMSDLIYAMEHPLERAADIAYIEGQLTGQALAEGLGSQDPAIAHQAEVTRQALIDEWQKLTGRAYTEGVNAANALERGLRTFNAPNFPVFGGGRNGEHAGGGGRAAGGPVDAGGTYLVGERGPELLHMGGGRGGYITPNHELGHGHDIYLDGRLVGRAIDERQGRQLALAPSSSYSR